MEQGSTLTTRKKSSKKKSENEERRHLALSKGPSYTSWNREPYKSKVGGMPLNRRGKSPEKKKQKEVGPRVSKLPASFEPPIHLKIGNFVKLQEDTKGAL